jgi:tubulin gamma
MNRCRRRAARCRLLLRRVSTLRPQVHKSLQRIRERKLANFIEWGPASIQARPPATCVSCATPMTASPSPSRCIGCTVAQVAVRADRKPRQRAHARQPHEVRVRRRRRAAPVRQTDACPTVGRGSIRHLFQRCLTQYDKLMRRKAFLDNYEQHAMFKVRRLLRCNAGGCACCVFLSDVAVAG